MQESAFTKKELQAVKKPLLQIIKTNRITNMVKLGKMLENLGYDERFGYHYNMVHVLKFHDIHKKDGHYQYIDPKNADYSDDLYLECWRCDRKQKYPEFPKGVSYIKTRLKICKTCLREENLITGESYAELVGIYSYLQYRYSHTLEKWMYRRFWESVLR